MSPVCHFRSSGRPMSFERLFVTVVLHARHAPVTLDRHGFCHEDAIDH
jgi:hypothetical protein